VRRSVCAVLLATTFGAAAVPGASAASWGPAVPISPEAVDVAYASAVQTAQGARVLALGVPGAEGALGFEVGVSAPGASVPARRFVLGGLPSYTARPVADGRGDASTLSATTSASGDRTLRVTTVTPTGEVSTVSLPVSFGARASAIAAGRDGDVAVAWVVDDGADEVVRVAVRRAGDADFGPAKVLLRGTDDGDRSGPVSIAVLDGGDVLVAWEHGPGASLLGGLTRLGSVRPPQALADGRWAQGPVLTGDGARALVTWVESPSDDRYGPRDLRLAVATIAGLGPVHTAGTERQGVSGDLPVAAARNGTAVVAWSSGYSDGVGSHGLGARTIDVDLRTGIAAESVPVTRANEFDPFVYDTPAAISLAPDGRALLALDRYGPVVAERAPGVREFRNPIPVSCRPGTTLLVGYEGDVPAVTWSDQNSDAAVRRVFVSRKNADASQACPSVGRGPFGTPEQPHVGEDTTFDASGVASREAPTEYRWDLDGDGTFELDWAERPVVHHVFTTLGDHAVNVEIRFRTVRGYRYAGGWNIRVLGVQPADAASPPRGIRPPFVPPVSRTPARGATVSAPTSPTARTTMSVKREISASVLLRRGAEVRLRAPRGGTVRVTAYGPGFRTFRASRRVAAGRTTTVRVRPKRTRRCSAGVAALTVRVDAPDGARLTRTLRVRCRA
jgi:hypothetical protein